jgi:hypothetical protein
MTHDGYELEVKYEAIKVLGLFVTAANFSSI